MRHCLLAVLLAACQSAGPSLPTTGLTQPTVPVAMALATGSRLRAELQDGLPDAPTWRAAAIWWREALRQTVRFELAEGPTTASLPSDTLVLSIDPAARTLAAHLRRAGSEQALAGETFADDDLAGAIDRLAWACRLALGEPAVAPVPVAACTTRVATALLAADDALVLLRDGALQGAYRALQAARQQDGASPFVLDALAAVELARGNAETAVRICREGLGYTSRLGPTTQHRLARTLLLARASLRPQDAPTHDRELLALAKAGQNERPHDAQIALSLALALNFLGEFATSRPLLEQLCQRLPEQAIVPYHLGWACLATGDARAAARHFETAALRLPRAWVVLPQSIALYEAGEHRALDDLLRTVLAETPANNAMAIHQVRRMQAAHALLQGDIEATKQLLTLDFSELLKNPTVIEQRAGEFAEQGAVLVRLGGGDSLPPLLAALQNQHPRSEVADACSFLQGLVEIHASREPATNLVARLSRDGSSMWGALLTAYAHEQRGEVADMQTALAEAARLSSSPVTKALLAHSLRTMGKVSQADALKQALHQEMSTIHLRQSPQHPLLGPELAFAWRAD